MPAGAQGLGYRTLHNGRGSILSSLRALAGRGAGSRMVSGFLLVAVLTIVAKVAAFLKDAAVARFFGTGDELDAFLMAFGLLAFACSLAGGALPEAFLPVYAGLRNRTGFRRAQRFAVQSAVLHGGILLVITGAAWLAAPGLILRAARGFPPEKQELAVAMLRGLLPFLLCFGMSFQLAAWLRAEKRFAAATSAPMLVPLTMLVLLLAQGAEADVWTLVHGTCLGAALHLMVLAACTAGGLRLGMRRAFLPDPGLRQVRRSTAHYLLAGVVFSSAVVVDQIMASWLEPGSVAVLGYSEKVCSIILAVTAAPAADVLFPYFADKVARQDWEGVRRQLLASAGLIISLALPAALLLCWLGPWVVGLLFERGSFTEDDTRRVGGVLRYAALQIPFYILGGLASRVVVAMQATRFVLMLSFLGLAGNAALNWLLMWRMGVAGIALSTVLVQMAASLLACRYVLAQIRRKLRAAE
mgnify:CR=1 FL=1